MQNGDDPNGKDNENCSPKTQNTKANRVSKLEFRHSDFSPTSDNNETRHYTQGVIN